MCLARVKRICSFSSYEWLGRSDLGYEQTVIVLCFGFVYYRYSVSTLLCLEGLCKATSNDRDNQRMSNRWLLQQGRVLGAAAAPPQAQGAPSPQHFSVSL